MDPNSPSQSTKRRALDSLDNSMLSPGVTYSSLKRPKPLLESFRPNITLEDGLGHDFNVDLLDSSQPVAENTLNAISDLDDTLERPSSAAAAGFANLTNTSQLELLFNVDTSTDLEQSTLFNTPSMMNLSTIRENSEPPSQEANPVLLDDSVQSSATIRPNDESTHLSTDLLKTPLANTSAPNPGKGCNTPNLESVPTSSQDVQNAYTRYSPIAKTRQLFEQVAGSGNLNTTMVGEFQDRLDEISFVHHELALNDGHKIKAEMENVKDELREQREQVANLTAQLVARDRAEKKSQADMEKLKTELKSMEKARNDEIESSSKLLKAVEIEKDAQTARNREMIQAKEAQNTTLTTELNEVKAKLIAMEQISNFTSEIKAFIETSNAKLVAEVTSAKPAQADKPSSNNSKEFVDEITKAFAEVSQKLKEANDNVTEQTKYLEELRALYKESAEQKKTDSTEISDLKSTNAGLTAQLSRLESERSQLLAQLEERQISPVGNNEDLLGQIEILEADKLQLLDQVDGLKRDLAEKINRNAFEALEKTNDVLTSQLEKLGEEKSDLLREIEELKNTQSDLVSKQELDQLKQTNALISEKLEKLEAEKAQYMAEYKELKRNQGAKGEQKEKEQLKKKVEALTDELEKFDDEKSELMTQIQDARRDLLSFKCRYGMITKKAAVKDLGDNKFKPPNCLFSTAQVKQIKQWISETTEDDIANFTVNKTVLNTTVAADADNSHTPSVSKEPATPGRTRSSARLRRATGSKDMSS